MTSQPSNILTIAPTGSDIIKIMPHNIRAEKALLGAIFMDNNALEMVGEFLEPFHFSISEHGIIFEAMRTIIQNGQLANPVTMSGFFEGRVDLKRLGGSTYLVELASSAVTVVNAASYGAIIHDLYQRREMIRICRETEELAVSEDVDNSAAAVIEHTEHALYELASNGEHNNTVKDFKAVMLGSVRMAEAAHNRKGGLSGHSTGLKDLDEMIGGLANSDLLILAGRPGMGKTAMATNIAYSVANAYVETAGAEGAPVGFFTLEMIADQLGSRIISEQTGIDGEDMRRGRLTTEQFTELAMASQTMSQIPLFVDDTPGLSITALRTRARRMKRQHNIGLIIVDYLQLIEAMAGSRASNNRSNDVSDITRGLKIIAKELNIPVIALSQLSRAVESRQGNRPQLSDLRESGSIEQDADVVIFVYREEYYLQNVKPTHGDDEMKHLEAMAKWEAALDAVKDIGEAIIAKNRHGPCGDVKLQFIGKHTLWRDLGNSPFT